MPPLAALPRPGDRIHTHSEVPTLTRSTRTVLAAATVGGFMFATAATAMGAATGSGASFPNRAYQQWCQESTLCSYTSKGSSGGIRDLIAGTVDFAGSDAPLTDTQKADLASRRGGVTPVYIPTLLGAVTVPTNISGVNGRIRLKGATIAQIFSGQINNWSDAKIKADNPRVTLPNAPITRCVRADGSGTSFAFSQAMSKFDRGFASTVGPSQTPRWPSNVPVVRGPQNPGVAQCVNANSNSIGYVDIADARAAGLLPKAAAVGHFTTKTVRIKGRSVKRRVLEFTTPSTVATSKAGNIKFDTTGSLDIDFTASAAPGAYPITTATWIVMYSNYGSAGKSSAKGEVQRAVQYFLSDRAQAQLASLQFAPLPDELLKAARRQLLTKVQ